MILVGEMRDLETISTALTAAETGHLVFATLHTQDAPQTIDRVIDVFPPEQQTQVRVQLSVTLQGIMTQTLLPTSDGSGRCVACEILIPTPGVRNLIREGKIAPDPVARSRPARRSACSRWTLPGHARSRRQDHAGNRQSRVLAAATSFAGCWASMALGRGMSTYAFKAMDLAGAPAARHRSRPRAKQAVSDQLRSRGLVILEIAEKHASRKSTSTSVRADHAQRPRGLLAPARDDGLFGHDDPARAVRARGADRGQEAKEVIDRGAQGRRGGPRVQRRARPPPEDIQPAVRRDGACRRDRRRARGLARADRGPAREGGRAAPPGALGDGLPRSS